MMSPVSSCLPSPPVARLLVHLQFRKPSLSTGMHQCYCCIPFLSFPGLCVTCSVEEHGVKVEYNKACEMCVPSKTLICGPAVKDMHVWTVQDIAIGPSRALR